MRHWELTPAGLWLELEMKVRGTREMEGIRERDGRAKQERSGSIPLILSDGANPHLGGILYPLEPLRSHRSPSKQPRERSGSAPVTLQPNTQ
jgi:hypothetical protein